MRICAPQLGISPKSILGGEIYDREILKEAANHGAFIEVILPLKKPYELNKNWRVTYLPTPFVVPPHLFNILVFPYVLYIYWKRPFEILRIHSPTFVGLAGILFKKIFPQVRLVSCYHWIGEGGFFEQFIDPFIMKYSDLIVCDSLHTASQLKNKYIQSKHRIHTVYNGVDVFLHPEKKSERLIERYHISKKTTVLLSMGVFTPRKNTLFLLSLVKKLIKKNVDVRLLLCGKGELKNEIEIQIKKMSLEKTVYIVDPVFGIKKNQLFNIADIFVHPALNEGFSLAVIEAMSVGLPICITNGYSSVEAVTHKVNGFLCSRESDWISQITQLSKNKKLRAEIKRNNIKKVSRNFRWPIIGSQHHKLLESLFADSDTLKT